MSTEFKVSLYHPIDIEKDEWRKLQTIQRDAYVSELFESREEIDHLTQYDDFSRFYTSHLDPNMEVGRRFNDNQSYDKPRVAVATKNGELVGWGYGAGNVSGTPEEQARKKLTVVKNYFWLRELAVDPEHQRQGVAKEMTHKLLGGVGLRPVTAYVWPDLVPFLPDFFIDQLGFKPTSEQPVELFGEGNGETKQVRLQARTALGVQWNLRRAA